MNFQDNIKRSRAHFNIQDRLSNMQDEISQQDNGESANRFVSVVQKYVLSR